MSGLWGTAGWCCSLTCLVSVVSVSVSVLMQLYLYFSLAGWDSTSLSGMLSLSMPFYCYPSSDSVVAEVTEIRTRTDLALEEDEANSLLLKNICMCNLFQISHLNSKIAGKLYSGIGQHLALDEDHHVADSMLWVISKDACKGQPAYTWVEFGRREAHLWLYICWGHRPSSEQLPSTLHTG